MRASFKPRSMISGTDLEDRTSLKLFDQPVKPVALYGSEMWGVNSLNYKNTESFMNSMNKIKCENLNISMCRSILGLHKKSQITATRGELGRFPLGIDIAGNVM